VTAGVLRVAAAQAVAVPGDVAANVATAVELVTEAADRGARVVVLPELFLTGYDPSVWDHDASLVLDDDDRPDVMLAHERCRLSDARPGRDRHDITTAYVADSLVHTMCLRLITLVAWHAASLFHAAQAT